MAAHQLTRFQAGCQCGWNGAVTDDPRAARDALRRHARRCQAPAGRSGVFEVDV